MAKLNFNLKKRRTELVERSLKEPGFKWHTCKNCDYNFEGNYCPSCGQSVTEVQKPIRHFLHDMFDSLLVFDVRIIRSLPTLLLKPGKISDEFIAGKRKKYVPPFRFFLFASIVFFFLIGMQTRQVLSPYMDDTRGSELADSIRQAKLEFKGVNSSGDSIVPISNLKEGVGFYEIIKQELRKELNDSTLTEKERSKKQNRLNSMENPNYVTSQIYKYISWSFFILMPFFALILHLFFRKKRKYYVEHLVFSVNLHTFYFVLLSIVVLIGMVFENMLKGMGPWILLVAFVYAMVGIRNYYSKRWVSSFFYTILTFFLYIFASLILLTIAAIIVISILNN